MLAKLLEGGWGGLWKVHEKMVFMALMDPSELGSLYDPELSVASAMQSDGDVGREVMIGDGDDVKPALDGSVYQVVGGERSIGATGV
jgi:hypothetical protein